MAAARDVDRGWAWLVLLASYINLLLCSGLAIVAGMFQVVFLEQYQGSVALTSWITALFSSLMQLAGPLSSAVANCISCRVAVMIGGVCLSLGLALSGLTSSLEFLFASFGVIAGIGLGLAYSASIVVINYYFDQRRTMVTGVVLSASGLGIVLAPQVATALLENLSWREALVILAGTAAQICVCGALMYPIHEKKNPHCVPLKRKLFTACGCLSCMEGEVDGKCNKKKVFQPYTDLEMVVEKVELVQDVEQNMGKENGDLITDSVNIKSHDPELTNEITVDPDNHHPVPVMTPLLDGNQIGNGVSIHDGQEVNPKPQPQPISNVGNLLNDYRGSGPLPEIPEDKTFLSSNGLPQIVVSDAKVKQNNTPLRNCVKDSRLSPPEIGSSISLDKTSKRRMSQFSNRHTSHTQSHFELYRHPHLLQASSSQHSLYLRPLPFDVGMLRRKQGHSNGMRSNHDLLPVLYKRGPVDKLCQGGHVIVVAHNQSLLSLVSSTRNLDIIDPKSLDCDNYSMSIRSNTSLHSDKHSFRQDIENAAASFKSSVMSVSPVPIPGMDDSPQRSLLCNSAFWILCLQLFLANAACGVFNIHLPSFVMSKGLTEHEMTNIMSVNGFALLFGRMSVGFLANAVGCDLLLYWALHILGGIALCLLPALGTSYLSVVVFTLAVGIYYGSVYSVLTTITIQYVGLTSLATAFGVEMVSAGFGFLVAPPCAGVLVDKTGSYDYNMYCGGALLIMSSLVLMVLPIMRPDVAWGYPQLDVDQGIDDNDNDDDDNDNDDDEVEKERQGNQEGKKDKEEGKVNVAEVNDVKKNGEPVEITKES